MARFRSDRDRLVAALFPVLALAAVNPVIPAELSGVLEFKSWSRLEHLDGNTSMHDAVISHGKDMQITARLAHREQLPGRVTRLTLSGGVHIDYRGAILDADSALIMFRDQQLQSGKVQGNQANFSYQPAGRRRATGKANSIEFEGASNRIHFAGNTSYTDGLILCKLEQIYYNLNDGSFVSNRGPGDPEDFCSVPLDERERIAPPRTPERSTAQ